MPSALVEQVQTSLHQPWMTDHHVKLGRVLGNPFLTIGKRDTGAQHTDPNGFIAKCPSKYESVKKVG